MTAKLYQALARKIGAFHSARLADIIKTDKNGEPWEDIHEDAIYDLLEELPHGSGIDGETEIDLAESTSDKLIIHSSYHAMGDGYYTHRIDYTVTLTPSLAYGYNLDINGDFTDAEDVREYLYDIYSNAFDSNIWTGKRPRPILAVQIPGAAVALDARGPAWRDITHPIHPTPCIVCKEKKTDFLYIDTKNVAGCQNGAEYICTECLQLLTLNDLLER